MTDYPPEIKAQMLREAQEREEAEERRRERNSRPEMNRHQRRKLQAIQRKGLSGRKL